jgi:hypothetical protein
VDVFGIQLPELGTAALTRDADFVGSRADAELIGAELGGVVHTATLDDVTPNSAVLVFEGTAGRPVVVDFLSVVIGLKDSEIKRLAVTIQLGDLPPVSVLHPVLVLQSRCANLERLPHKRSGNGVMQARVACDVVKAYLDLTAADPTRKRAALNIAKRLARLAQSPAGTLVWAEWGIDVSALVSVERMPAGFARSWAYEVARTARKRDVLQRQRAQSAARKSTHLNELPARSPAPGRPPLG